MIPLDEMNETQKAWLVCKKLKEMQNLLWEMYCEEFCKLQERDDMLSIDPESMPF